MNGNIRISRLEILRLFGKCDFSTMVSSDDEGLSQRYLQVVDSNKKIFMPQNRQAAISKCSPIWKKMKKKKKKVKISKVKVQAHSQKEVWKSWYQLEKEPYFPYGKRAQIEKISKLF